MNSCSDDPLNQSGKRVTHYSRKESSREHERLSTPQLLSISRIQSEGKQCASTRSSLSETRAYNRRIGIIQFTITRRRDLYTMPGGSSGSPSFSKSREQFPLHSTSLPQLHVSDPPPTPSSSCFSSCPSPIS